MLDLYGSDPCHTYRSCNPNASKIDPNQIYICNSSAPWAPQNWPTLMSSVCQIIPKFSLNKIYMPTSCQVLAKLPQRATPNNLVFSTRRIWNWTVFGSQLQTTLRNSDRLQNHCGPRMEIISDPLGPTLIHYGMVWAWFGAFASSYGTQNTYGRNPRWVILCFLGVYTNIFT